MEDRDFYLKKSKLILQEVKKTVVGKDEILSKILMAILAKGHVLIEDIPGVGKTTIALAFAKALGIEMGRMQFTPDVMPSDVTGFNMYNRVTNEFEYKPGAVMTNLFLADEINRTSPKTQSALLEVMEEGCVTVDGVTRRLPEPFIVMATQNPFGSIGTQKLPESQLDRFMICISIGYPTVEEEAAILKSRQNEERHILSRQVITQQELVSMRDMVSNLYVDDRIYDYVARIAKATRNHPMIAQGVSPRGSISILSMAKAGAFLRGHDYVMPSDVQSVLSETLVHRMVIDSNLQMERTSEDDVIRDILRRVGTPKLTLKEIG